MKELTNKIINLLRTYTDDQQEVLRALLEELLTYFKGGTQFERTQRFFRYYESQIQAKL